MKIIETLKSWLAKYEATSWHQWWVKNVWQPSWTKLTSAVYGIPAIIYSGLEVVTRFANDPTIQGYMAKLNLPDWLAPVLAVVAIVHYVASGRD